MKKEVLKDTDTIIEDEFDEEWERETAPPQWKLDQLRRKSDA